MRSPLRHLHDPLIAPLWLLLLVGALCLVLPMLVLYYQFTSPSDGARMSKLPLTTDQTGIYVEALSVNSSLQNGDLVTSVKGIPMVAWAEALWRPSSWGFPWKVGETIPYTIVRGGVQVEIPVLLGMQPIKAVLARNWSILLYTFVFQIIAIFILIQKPREPAAQALFIWGMTTSHFYVWSTYQQIYDFVSGYGFWLYISVASLLWVSSWASGLHLAITFPTPLPFLRRRPKLIWMLYPVAFAIYLSYLVLSRIIISSQLVWIGYWTRGDTLIAILLFIPSVIAMIWQYRLHRRGPERQKIQLVVYSGLFAGSMAMVLYLLPEFLGLPRFGVNIVGVLLMPFPLAIALAIWRYQLFDINLIIHRTLVYGALTLTLGLVFFSGVTLLQGLFAKLTGVENSPVAIVISTLAIAALFNPLRIRIQRVIDRRFYRRKYDAQKELERFAAAARNEVELEQLTLHLLNVVNETMQPDQATLWLRPMRKPTPSKD
jgi:hypothetical protein